MTLARQLAHLHHRNNNNNNNIIIIVINIMLMTFVLFNLWVCTIDSQRDEQKMNCAVDILSFNKNDFANNRCWFIEINQSKSSIVLPIAMQKRRLGLLLISNLCNNWFKRQFFFSLFVSRYKIFCHRIILSSKRWMKRCLLNMLQCYRSIKRCEKE